jgi:NAD(P)-dependent dehydrogenase (short-subunit alcohol dehydrogenase family)
MAKKQAISKTQAVRDYLKAHPGAMSKEIAAALTKQGITINAGHVANIKTKINKEAATKKAAKQPAAVAAAPVAPAAVEKPTTNGGGTITLDQVKKVAQTIKTLGGFQRMTELLAVIKELGGVKKFKDLAEAMTVTEPEAVTNGIPF